MPAETIALKPTDVSEGPIGVAAFSSINSIQIEGGLARMYEVGVFCCHAQARFAASLKA